MDLGVCWRPVAVILKPLEAHSAHLTTSCSARLILYTGPYHSGLLPGCVFITFVVQLLTNSTSVGARLGLNA
jgi:hypothetical protein